MTRFKLRAYISEAGVIDFKHKNIQSQTFDLQSFITVWLIQVYCVLYNNNNNSKI